MTDGGKTMTDGGKTMTELEKTKIELKFSINLFSRFCELVEKDLGREKVTYLLFLAQAKAIKRYMESNEDELS